MNLCKALSKESLWDTEGLELKNQEIRIQNGLASVCRQLRTSPSIFPQFAAARTACLNASARWLLSAPRQIFPFMSGSELYIEVGTVSTAAYVTAAVEIICPALFNFI